MLNSGFRGGLGRQRFHVAIQEARRIHWPRSAPKVALAPADSVCASAVLRSALTREVGSRWSEGTLVSCAIDQVGARPHRHDQRTAQPGGFAARLCCSARALYGGPALWQWTGKGAGLYQWRQAVCLGSRPGSVGPAPEEWLRSLCEN